MNPYLSFTSGQCRAAFEHYQQALGATCVFISTWAESPMADQAPGGDGNQIMHATLQFPDGTILMGADCPPEYGSPFGGFSLSINTTDVAEAERAFAAIAEGGKVTMPLEKTFWAERFGMCTDRFGVGWMVNCEMKAPAQARGGSALQQDKVFAIQWAKLYPMYVAKVEAKGRTREELDQVIRWLTGYTPVGLRKQNEGTNDLETFYGKAPKFNANASLVTGVVCGIRVEEIEHPLMRRIRTLDKLVDELAKGKAMEKILRG